MTPYLQDPDVALYHGDALEVLRELPDESVHCIATSPPFYALRDYGTGRWEGGDLGHEHDRVGARGGRGGSGTLDKRSGDAMPATLPAGTCSCGAVYRDPQIGLEETPDAWAAALVAVFREARRVLRKDGTLWVECGDSYASNPGDPAKRGTDHDNGRREWHPRGRRSGVKPKDLIGQPWLLAFALRADGWWLRGCNIWAKPNAMPESAKDRCTMAHSYVFQLSKSARYFFDGDAISEAFSESTIHRFTEGQAPRKGRSGNGLGIRPGNAVSGSFAPVRPNESKHPRSVWNIPTQGYPEAHFATWPEALARRIILAGCPEWVCSVCGEARVRKVEREFTPQKNVSVEKGIRGHAGQKPMDVSSNWQDVPRGSTASQTLGYTDCGHNAYEPGFVLDPFVGSGTTCFVARKLGRRSIGIDLSAEYLALAAKRLQQQSLFA